MARPNYEAQFKQKLQDRELKPSADSWEKLSGRMEQEGKEEASSPYKWWMGMAAAFVAGLLVMNFFFSSPTAQDSPAFVDEAKENRIEKGVDKSLDPITEEESQYAVQEKNSDSNTPAGELGREQKTLGSVDYASVGEEEKSPESETRNSALERSSSKGSSSENRFGRNPQRESEKQTAIAGVEEQGRIDSNLVTGDEGDPAIDEDVLTQKLREVVAEANVMEEAAGEISDAEINALLLAASAEIDREQVVANERLSASELLYEVEMELEESFRAKVFELLKEGFRKTRTAVANINN